MISLYTILFILQALCVYHAYRNNVEQRWYWFIIFFPGLGCALYLYHNFYSRNNIQRITESVKGVVHSNYRIEQLEKAKDFSDNIANKINLADAYAAAGRYPDAIALYENCLAGYMADDPPICMKMLSALYRHHDFDSAVKYGSMLENEKEFKNAEQRIDFAWSLHKTGKTESAYTVFRDMNKSFTNYKQRVEFCRFLIEVGNQQEFDEILSELIQELGYMKGPERRLYKDVISEIREFESARSKK